jgi:hypothetical protein
VRVAFFTPAKAITALTAVGTVTVMLALAGCASVSKTYDAQGREAYALDCTGWGRSWVTCQDKAVELCGPRGYTVSDLGSGPVFVAGTLTSNRKMTVTCGPEKEPAGVGR